MKNYYFTFGQLHWNKDGYPMKNSWVRVVAESYDKARSIFVQEFAMNWMEKPDKWSFQYEEDKFEPEWFPSGEFMVLYQNSPISQMPLAGLDDKFEQNSNDWNP